ncbi:hypothetical protein PC128_g5214 [Phytophthora cactorum]|nr:hypothetical protein PC128_g5214 [Phytophthora cactorum]
MVSNAESAIVGTVIRLVGSESQSIPAPECIAQYNINMQGVNRLGQIRGRFSTADGHSYKRWHKKLALALIDVARSNAYLTRRLVKLEATTRDPPRKFGMELVASWRDGCCARDNCVHFHVFTTNLRGEEQEAPSVYRLGPAKPWMCPLTTPTCWDKFHQFYYPNDLFTDMGNVRRHSNLAKLKDISEPMYSDLLPLAKLLTGCLAILLVTDSATKEIMDSVVKGLLRSG